MLSFALAAVLAISPDATAPRTQYAGHQVVRAYPDSREELDFLLTLTEDVWTHHIHKDVAFRISPELLPSLVDSGIPYDVIHADLGAAAAREARRMARWREKTDRQSRARGPITEYFNLAEHTAFVDALAEDHRDIVSLEEIGRSIEDRPIRAMRVSGKGGDDKPVLMILSGHHAREWLAHHASLCLFQRFIEGYGTDDVATFWLDHVEMIMITMGNPDGYDHTHTTERYWRKNRNPTGGVDLNRNWDVAWGTASSDDTSHDTFHGTGPFSEPETQAYADYISSHRSRIAGFIDIHSFGSVILLPYGYTEDRVDNHEEYMDLGDAMSDAMDGAYEPLTISDFVGRASGSSVDWVHDEIDDGLSIAFETRGDDFVEDDSEIQPTCDELWPALIVLLETFEVAEDPDDDDDDDDDTGDDSSDTGDDPSDTGDDPSDTGDDPSETEDGDTGGCGCSSRSADPLPVIALVGGTLAVGRSRRRRARAELHAVVP